jgi:hypothetical protein
MTILGILALVVGAVGFLLVFTGAGGSLLPYLGKMPLGLGGWALLAAVGIVMLILNRRPSD